MPRRGKRHDGDVFINPAHVALVEPSSADDDHVTDGRATTPQAGLVRVLSDHDAFDLVERNRVRRPVVQLRRPRRRVTGDLLRVLKRPPVRQIR